MKSVIALLLLGTTFACGPGTRNDDDQFGGGDGGNGGSGGSGGSGGDGCSAASKLIYTVDQHNALYQFDPTTKSFTNLGPLMCPGTGPDPQDPLFGSDYEPFSMGVDRNATAYVLFNDTNAGGASKIFKVDTTTTGLPCTATNFNSPANFQEFGMGFSTTTAGGDTDALFVAGGTNVDVGATSTLHTIDVSSMGLSAMIGTTGVKGSPELTGNANAELWGFFPDTTSPKIAQIDKTTGATTDFPLTDSSFKGQPLAWAFAFYGGDYWIFLQKDTGTMNNPNPEASTTVYQVSDTGMLKGKTPAPGKLIVGAGVSTCAPVVIE